MKLQSEKSINIIDRRTAPKYGASWFVGLIMGLIVGAPVPPVPDSDLVQVVSTALDRGQTFWSKRIAGWRDAKVILYTRMVESPCGIASEYSGPFYCPENERIYIDLRFLRSMPGDFGQAYVIAHELGHHVQKVVGGLNHTGYKIELQADCYAGMWIKSEIDLGNLEDGEVQEAYNEAIAASNTGTIDTWTHGDAPARVDAIQRGISTGICEL